MDWVRHPVIILILLLIAFTIANRFAIFCIHGYAEYGEQKGCHQLFLEYGRKKPKLEECWLLHHL